MNDTAPTPEHTADTRQNLRRIIHFALRRAGDKNLTQVASSLTFTTVLGIVPMLAVVLALFTAFPLFAEFQQALEEFLTNSLMPPAVSSTVMSYLNQFASKASGLTTVGGLALLVTSVMLIRTIDDTFDSIWQVQARRPLGRRLLIYWVIITLGPILAGASLWASSVMMQQSLSLVEQLPASVRFLLSAIPVLLTALGFTGLFMMVPNCPVHWRDALAGGIVTAVVLGITRWGFAYYLSRFPSYTIIYGAFATVPIFLMWIYISWLAVLSGATLAATLPAIRHRHWEHASRPGADLLLALDALRALWPHESAEEPGARLENLADALGRNPEEMASLLDQLRALGMVARCVHDDAERWLLVADPRKAELGPVVRALLLDEAGARADGDETLSRALALVFAGETVTLETLFEKPQTLSDLRQFRQNSRTT